METIDRKQSPAFKTIGQIDIIKATEQKLDNGIPVYTVDAGTQELIKIELIFRAGIRQQSAPLAASITNSMLNEGTSKRSAQQIADAVDYYGAFLETGVDHDYASVSLYTLNKHLASTLPVVEEIIKDSVFPQGELDTMLQNKKQKFIVEGQKVNHLARRKFGELIFGTKHPYGKVLRETDFDTLQRSSLVAFHKGFYHAGNCRIVLAGKVEKNMHALLNKHFGGNDWSNPKPAANPNAGPFESAYGKHLVAKDDALQSAIRMGRLLFNKKHPDYQRMQVLNTILGGYFGSRLMANIREDKGYTYGIGSGVVSLQETGYFFISTEVGVDVCNAAIGEVYKEMKRLRDEPVPADELDLVKNYLLGAFLRSVDGPFALADKFKGIMEYDLGYDYFDRFIHTIRTISATELMELANTYLKEDVMTELVAGKR